MFSLMSPSLSTVDPYEVVIYTAAFGEEYTALASDWCDAVNAHLLVPLSERRISAASFVLTNREHIDACDHLIVHRDVEPNKTLDSKRQLGIKLLKMSPLPVTSDLYMWIDIDMRPTRLKSAWFLDTLFTTNIDPANGIAVTFTRSQKKYNGGLFVYKGRGCIDHWKELVVGGLGDTRGRDQPYLKAAVRSANCNLTLLPPQTQTHFDPRALQPGAFDFAFVHFSGVHKKQLWWYKYLKIRHVY
jgi:hypothetical protein